jgi:hypothetical protein
MSAAVTVAGGAPSLALSNGATATYDAAHSTATSLAFDYTVAGGQSTSSLAVTGINLNGATVTDVAGNAANLAGADSTFSSVSVNAAPASITTLNPNGTIHDVHYYGITGQAYTDYDVLYGANNKAAEAIFSDGMTETWTYNQNGTLASTELNGSAGNMSVAAGGTVPQVLVGGAGDTLTGGSSADTFIFPANLGNETINNFNTANDVIELPAAEVANFAALQADLHEAAASAVITVDAHDSITLSHVAVQNLTAQNFHFLV